MSIWEMRSNNAWNHQMSDKSLCQLGIKIGELLQARNMKICLAESCTGGWIAKCITDVPGSSAWFDRSFVTYSNESKSEMLGVPEKLIDSDGAVSETVVKAMVGGALERSRADIAVAVSGVAGPGGGSDDKPVGTVWFAWQKKGGNAVTEKMNFPGDREAVRAATVDYALSRLQMLLSH